MTYRTEFPDFPESDMPTLPEGFEDTSWHNDVCPSYQSLELSLHIFIDYADVSLRESAGCDTRFSVYVLSEEGYFLADESPVVASNNWQDVLAYVEYRKRVLGISPIIIR